MKLWIFLAVAAVLVALRFATGRRPLPTLAWVGVWWVAIFVALRFGFTVPIPHSVLGIYMGIATLSLIAFASSSRRRWQSFEGPLVAFLTERRFTPLLALVALAIPAAVSASIYLDMTAPPVAPAFGRTVHPAPPDEITVHDENISLINLENPYRSLEESDPEAFRGHVANGRQVYYENCFYCHGDLMQGEGMFAHGLNPIPTNFPVVVDQLQEGFLFWRVAKGAPGLPEEGGPWDSAMPAWEKFLSEQEMWEVILFLYDFSDKRPRAVEHEASPAE
jgi:mono/diheme cytochrome c family protein